MIQELTPAEKLDVEIGVRVRHVRKLRNMTQTQLGESIGVTFQQIQKYERGTNRISTSALILLARALNVSPGALLGLEGGQGVDLGLLAEDGARDLLKALTQIRSPEHRRIIAELAQDLAGQAGAAPQAA